MKQMSDRAPVRQQGLRWDSSPPEHSKIVLLAFVYLHYFIAVMSCVSEPVIQRHRHLRRRPRNFQVL